MALKSCDARWESNPGRKIKSRTRGASGVPNLFVGGPRADLCGRRDGTVSLSDGRPWEVVPSSSWTRHDVAPEEGSATHTTTDHARHPAPLSRMTEFR